MPASNPRKQTVGELNALRRRAVELRVSGKTLAETHSVVGLSTPTIIAAVKAYKQGGWDAVDVGPRGRPKIADQTEAKGSVKADLLKHATLPELPALRQSPLWNGEQVQRWIQEQSIIASRSTVLGWLHKWALQPESRYAQLRKRVQSPQETHGWKQEHERFARRARRSGRTVYWVSSRRIDTNHHQIFAHDLRGHAHWCLTRGSATASHYYQFLQALLKEHPKGLALVFPSAQLIRNTTLVSWLAETHTETLTVADPADAPLRSYANKSFGTSSEAHDAISDTPFQPSITVTHMSTNDETEAAKPPATDAPQGDSQQDARTLTHLQRLEAESIHIMREVVAEAENPVMLYSIGKDSAVMLHLARKAFYPSLPPFPLLHVDTTWKFQAMYKFRDEIVKEYGLELLTHINPEGLAQKVNPFTHGSSLHTDIMKTQGLKQALDEHKFDFAFGGARRDEEKSRAKERVFSFRSAQHRWDAKNQRPELWSLYNARKQRDESIRVFPISNWTELDIWQYIHRENIPIVPLYLAAERPVVMRDGSMIMVDDERMPLKEGEVPEMRNIRFRTLGCYPLTGAVESTATTLEGIIQEMLLTRTSERQGRMIDHDSAASMEKKKQEGYF